MTNKLRIVPLGGLGEIGRNMMAIEFANDLIVVDAGLMFPEEDMLGVDLVIPDITYILERSHKLRGIFITHGHEDHTGALPYVLKQIQTPIYCSRLTRGLISVKLDEHHLLDKTDLRTVQMGERIQAGAFTVEFVHVTHSIPDSAALAITTPVGTVFHTGDFKFDHTPVMGEPSDLLRIAELGRQGVLLLCSDSTYAEVPGYTDSEQNVGSTFEHVLASAEDRVIVATFASLISRVQQLADAASKTGRQVFVTGRSMLSNVKMALKQGYITTDQDLLMPLDRMRNFPPNQVLVITTGAQGEPMSSLVRMANKDHRHIELVSGDTVIFSSSPIPGNEMLINKTIDNLYRLGVRVLHSRNAQVHVRGHAAQEELKLMLSLVRPRFFVPVHGEYRHMAVHAGIARTMGVAQDAAIVMEDGDILELDQHNAEIVGKTSADYVYVDGLSVGVDHVVMRDRRHLAGDGVLVVIVGIDRHSGKPTGFTDVVSRGFADGDMEEVMQRTRHAVQDALAGADHVAERSEISTRIHQSLGKFIYQETKRRPLILPVIVEV